MRQVVRVFWGLVLCDGILLVADGFWPVAWLGVLCDSLAALTLLASLIMALLVVATPRVSLRFVAPLILFVWWAVGTQAFPWGFGEPMVGQALAGATQVALAVILGVVFRAELLGPASRPDRPAFSWRRSLLTAPLAVLAFAAVVVLGVFTALADELESYSGGYVRLRPDGIYLLERRFAEGGREVCLSGMMHIADEEFYSDLLPAEDPQKPSVVLVEGVTDQQNLLGDQELSYGNVAQMLSVSAQENSPFMERVMAGLLRHRNAHAEGGADGGEPEEVFPAGTMDFVRADVDVQTFHPKTITFIVTVMSLVRAKDLAAMMEKWAESRGPLNDESAQRQVIQDILHARNDYLVGEIEKSLKSYRRVIVPWGALHLVGVETWLREQDFQPVGETQRRAVGFW
jgi:hypothetical protein